MENLENIDDTTINNNEGEKDLEEILLEDERKVGDLEHIENPALSALLAVLDKAKDDPEKMKNLKGLLEYNPARFSKH
jgi:hypothetical protein